MPVYQNYIRRNDIMIRGQCREWEMPCMFEFYTQILAGTPFNHKPVVKIMICHPHKHSWYVITELEER